MSLSHVNLKVLTSEECLLYVSGESARTDWEEKKEEARYRDLVTWVGRRQAKMSSRVILGLGQTLSKYLWTICQSILTADQTYLEETRLDIPRD